MNVSQKRKTLYRIITVGLMAALVYVGNYLQIKIPNGVLVTRIHLGNSMCLLAGLLFGGVSGGLSSGIGAALYDLFDPAYITSAPFTFINKFAMGFMAGLLNRTNINVVFKAVFSAVAGQIVYIILYLAKTYFKMILVMNSTAEAAWAAVGTNSVTSLINGALAVAISVPLYFALKKALSHTEIAPLICGENKIASEVRSDV